MQHAIEFAGVSLSLGGERIYDSLDFAVRPGEFLCLLGPSGCGKSTSLRIIDDLMPADSGLVTVNGRSPRDSWSDIAFVFQSPRLAPWLTALDNILLGVELRFGRAEAKRRRARAESLLAMVGLAGAAKKYPAMLSGGERQRVAIARALAVDPSIILMDEPFSALDPNTRRRLRGEIERIWLETGCTIVFVTHDIDEAITLADRIVLLSNKPTRVLETLDVTAARGLDLRILSAALYAQPAGEGGGIWVKKDSPIKTAADLKGKTLASYGLRSTGYMFVREAVAKKYGLNMALEGGDVKQVEIVAPNLPAALATGQVDAASLIHSQAFRAKQSGEFVNICETGQILNDVYGPLVSAVNVGYPERLAARPEAFKEFCRMMKESSAYALSHRDEVFGDLAKVANVDRSFFDWWFDRTTAVPGTFNAKHAAAVTKAWEIAKAFGMIQSVPDVGALTWEQALKA